MKEVILTPEGYEKLKQEIDTLSTERRREVADRIRVAREFGDISENAEYDDAKNEQAMLEHKIAKLEERLANARVIDQARSISSVVSIGAKVRLRDVGRQADGRVHDRRLGRGGSGRAEALERVAGRQGDHRQEEGRDRRGRPPRAALSSTRSSRSKPRSAHRPAPPTGGRSLRQNRRPPATPRSADDTRLSRGCAEALSPPAVRRQRSARSTLPPVDADAIDASRLVRH